VVVSFSPLVPLLLTALLVLWGVSTLLFYREAREAEHYRRQAQLYAERLRSLTLELAERERENAALAGKVAEMHELLDGFASEIDELRERAGLEPKRPPQNKKEPLGAGRPASTDELLAAVALRVEQMKQELEHEVIPALDLTLRREAATPQGWPLLSPTRVASGFGVRKNPFGRGYEFHDGIDLPAPYGTPILATAPGVVVEAGWSRVLGRYVKVDHGFGYQTVYGHMSRIRVARGDRVQRGEVVGYVGSTGRSTGPHVHYAVIVGGRPVNPRPYLDAGALAGR